MKMTTRLGLTTGIALSFAFASLSFVVSAADGPHDKAIKARQAMYQTLGFNAGILGDMAKEDIPYDAEVASEAAANLDAAANFGQSQMWPPGSDNATEGNAPTRALPAIWENLPSVIEKSDALKQASAAMVASAGGGLAALQGAMGDLGATCKSCHDDFRAKRR